MIVCRFIPFPDELLEEKDLGSLENERLQEVLGIGLNSPLYYFWQHILPASLGQGSAWSGDDRMHDSVSKFVSVEQEAFALLTIRNSLAFWVNLSLQGLGLIQHDGAKKHAFSYSEHHAEQGRKMKAELEKNSDLFEILKQFSSAGPEWSDQRRNRTNNSGEMKRFNGWKSAAYHYFEQASGECYTARGMQSGQCKEDTICWKAEKAFNQLVQQRKLYRAQLNRSILGVYITQFVILCVCLSIIFSNPPISFAAGIREDSDSDDEQIKGVVTVDNFEERLRARTQTRAASDFMAFVAQSGGVTQLTSATNNEDDDGDNSDDGSQQSSLQQSVSSDTDSHEEDAKLPASIAVDADEASIGDTNADDDEQSVEVSAYTHTCIFVSLVITPLSLLSLSINSSSHS